MIAKFAESRILLDLHPAVINDIINFHRLPDVFPYHMNDIVNAVTITQKKLLPFGFFDRDI